MQFLKIVAILLVEFAVYAAADFYSILMSNYGSFRATFNATFSENNTKIKHGFVYGDFNPGGSCLFEISKEAFNINVVVNRSSTESSTVLFNETYQKLVCNMTYQILGTELNPSVTVFLGGDVEIPQPGVNIIPQEVQNSAKQIFRELYPFLFIYSFFCISLILRSWPNFLVL